MTPLTLVDTHCHLNLAAFVDDLPLVIERARQAGVRKILVPGLDLVTSRRAVELAERHPEIYAAVGIHPHFAKLWDAETAQALRALAGSPKVVAIGEIGLDYHRNLSSPEQQRAAFQAQLALARSLEFAVVVHTREAIDDALPLLEDWRRELPKDLQARAGVLHAFSSHEAAASQAIQQGFYIGIAGPITFPNAGALRQMASHLPLDRLLIETDAPYLAPVPYRGKRNEPAYVRAAAATLAEIRAIDLETVTRQIADNAQALFRWNHESTDRNVF